MKTETALQAPAYSRKLLGKKCLIMGIIYLASEKLINFASVISVLWSGWGVLFDDTHAIAYGTLVWFAVFMPWAWRRTARDLRQDRLGLKQW